MSIVTAMFVDVRMGVDEASEETIKEKVANNPYGRKAGRSEASEVTVKEEEEGYDHESESDEVGEESVKGGGG